MDGLSSDLLGTFLAVAETGSVTEGAARIYRSQSAASMQIKKLEAVLGRPVFDRHGRGVVLTEIGRRLLPVAREVALTLDVAYRSLTADQLTGKLRLGIPDDRSHALLAGIVGAFSQSHPLVELEVTCALSTGFAEALRRGRLDLAIYEVESPAKGDDILLEDPTFWVTSAHHDVVAHDPLPIALFDRDCWWRDAALTFLQKSGRRFQIVFSSQSVAGVAAAIEAGVAIGLLGASSLRDGLLILGEDQGFGRMPVSTLILGCAAETESAPIAAMKAAIHQAFRP
ncbi:MAG: LysR family transcriptional regulator [Rhodospirillales bacterium]|nr:LysR family transcriptional regulator [Rhodospirillales bacterium]